MPELPEVETVARDLRGAVTGRRIEQVTVDRPDVIRYPDGRGGPAFRAGDLLVWGFTALLLDRVLALSGWEREWDAARVTALAPGEIPGGWPATGS